MSGGSVGVPATRRSGTRAILDDMAQKRQWADLSVGTRAAIVAAGAVQLTLLGVALNDLRKRPATSLNGPKRLWVALCFVNFVGPISYFVFGRKRV